MVVKAEVPLIVVIVSDTSSRNKERVDASSRIKEAGVNNPAIDDTEIIHGTRISHLWPHWQDKYT